MENIREALAAYGMETCEYEVIRHNENITCKVVNDGKAYVLRIHQPIANLQGERIDYDNALCNRMISEIRHAVELGHLSEECAEKCIAEIHAVEQVQHKQTERYGKTLIHADIFLSFFVLLFICTQHEHVYQEEWFKGALAMWCENLFIH